jgi:addiction module HigA family antidote
MNMTNIINGMRPIHPGEVLREEFLQPLGMTPPALAKALQVPPPRINDVVRERRALMVDTALRLSKYYGTSTEFWMGLQTDFDMAKARATMTDALSRIVSRDAVLN